MRSSFIAVSAAALIVAAVFCFVTAVNINPNTSSFTKPTMIQSDTQITSGMFENKISTREVKFTDAAALPVVGSVPTEQVQHIIPLEDIRRGCFRQDCIPSIEDPQFISPQDAAELLASDSLGIALSFRDSERFYPFPMLETHELVNDVIDGEPVLISYCPLCGTGIVFNRRVGVEVFEFGVSGMLWQSNLLMYNRNESIDKRNLWSQVLGEAVVGEKAGTKLTIIPSDITTFSAWAAEQPEGVVLDSGRVADPYDGEYYTAAQNFAPNFDPATSPLTPMTYVYGIEIAGKTKAYPRDLLPEDQTEDFFVGERVIINKEGNAVSFFSETGGLIPDVEGFWFSWIAAHPESELWSN